MQEGEVAQGDSTLAEGALGPHPGWSTWVACVLALAVVLRLRHAWTVLGDHALMQMWTAAVGTGATPLVGPDARFGWNHLGPWLFYLMAVPYRLLGGSTRGLLLGAGAINVASVLLIVRAARQVAGDAAAAVLAAGACVFVLTAAGPRLVDPWNPYVAQLPFLLALVACWAVLRGRHRWFAVVVGAGSLCVQAHITFLPPVVAVLVASGVKVVIDRRTVARRDVLVTAAVTFAAWLPTTIDLLLPGRRNAYRVARWFVSPGRPTLHSGPDAAWHVVLRETGLAASWLGVRPGVRVFSDAFDGRMGVLPGVGLVALVGTAVVAQRRRDASTLAFVGLLGLLLCVGLAEMTAASGPMYPYLFGWISIVGMLCWLAPLLAWATRVSGSWAGVVRAAPVLAAVAVVVTSATSTMLPHTPRERDGDAAVVATLADTTEAALVPGTAHRLVHGHDRYSSIYELGIAARLRSSGLRLSVPPDQVVLFGRHMISARVGAEPGIEVVAPFEGVPAGGRLLALSDPLSADERAEESGLVRFLVDHYRASGHESAAQIATDADGPLVGLAGFEDPDPALAAPLARLQQLRMRGRSVAVIELPPGDDGSAATS